MTLASHCGPNIQWTGRPSARVSCAPQPQEVASKYGLGDCGHFDAGNCGVMGLTVGALNPQLQYVARRNIWTEKTSFNHFSDKTETEGRRSFRNLRAVYLWIHTLHYSLTVSKCAENSLSCELYFVINFFLSLLVIFSAHDVPKITQVKLYESLRILHSVY